MERMQFESKIALIAKRYNLSYKWTALRFGYRRVEIECEDFDEAYAVSCLLQRHKSAPLFLIGSNRLYVKKYCRFTLQSGLRTASYGNVIFT